MILASILTLTSTTSIADVLITRSSSSKPSAMVAVVHFRLARYETIGEQLLDAFCIWQARSIPHPNARVTHEGPSAYLVRKFVISNKLLRPTVALGKRSNRQHNKT